MDAVEKKTDDVMGVMGVGNTPIEPSTAPQPGPTKEKLLEILHTCGCAGCMAKAAILEGASRVESMRFAPDTSPSVEEWSTLKDFMFDIFRFERKSIGLEYFERSFGGKTTQELGEELHNLFVWINDNTKEAVLKMYEMAKNPNKQTPLPGTGKYSSPGSGEVDYLNVVCSTNKEKDAVMMVVLLWDQAIFLSIKRPYSFDCDPLRALDLKDLSHLRNAAAFKILSNMQQALVKLVNDTTVEIALP